MPVALCTDPDMDGEDRYRIGKRVRALREALKLTQERVAENAGGNWTRPYVAKIERGDNQVSTVEARRALARGLQIDEAQLGDYLDGKVELDAVVDPGTGTKRVYDVPKDLSGEAFGRHPDWQYAKDEALRLYGRTIDPEILAKVERAGLGEPLEFITAEMVKRIHDTIEAAEIEKRRRAESGQARKR
jgi:transcriptional regulator with XRE-family HTH domain